MLNEWKFSVYDAARQKGITKVVEVHPNGVMNVCAKFHLKLIVATGKIQGSPKSVGLIVEMFQSGLKRWTN